MPKGRHYITSLYFDGEPPPHHEVERRLKNYALASVRIAPQKVLVTAITPSALEHFERKYANERKG